jgi:DNA-binding transcriptional ArsR family regulator
MSAITNIDDPRYVRALAHPLRVRILAVLEERTASPVQLAGLLQASLGTVSYHVRTLHRLGLIDLVDETPVRGAVEHHYRARPRPQVSAEAWVAAPPVAKQALLGAALQQVLDYATASAAAGGFDRADAHVTRTTLQLDAQGLSELSQACVELYERLEAIESAARERREREDHAKSLNVGLVVLLFEALRFSDALPPGKLDGGDQTSTTTGNTIGRRRSRS